MMTVPVRIRRLLSYVAAAVLALALLVALRPSAEAADYRNHIARDPETPTSAETVTVWIESNTAWGETAAVETRINGNYVKYYGSYDDTNGPDPSNWKVELPAQPNGTFVEYQLFNCNGSGCSNEYGHTTFNWSYTVNDGDVQWDGLKHDTFDAYYRSPFGAVPADDDVTLRFRTVPLDVDGVALRVYTYDPATQATTGPVDYAMTYLEDRVEDSNNYAIWTYTLDTPNDPALLYYHFVVTDGLDVDYYSDDHGGPHDNLNQGGTGATSDNQGTEGFQLTVYNPAFETPDWLQNAVVYQIFPDRFRNGDPTNDYCTSGNTTGCPLFYGDQNALLRDPWNTAIGDPREVGGPYENEYGTQFYGGDLQGLIDKLDYLKAAGFDTIYTTPIFDGSSNHRYDTDDYLEIDPALGDLTTFDTLIDQLNARGMKLIVDGVFNHTSSDSLYFDRYHRYAGNDGACESLASDYRDWFEFQNNDVPCGDGDYTGWFGYSSLAVLQDGSSEVRDFIYRDANSVMETWYDRGVHGWRFDVADEISHDWWRDFRPYAKADAPNGPLVGEVWPDASAFLLGDQLDSVMNYRFRKNVLGFVRQNDFTDNDNNGNNEIISLTPSQFDRALRSVREDYPPEATLAMLNLLDSHDTNRLRYLVDILGESDAETLQRQKLAALFQYTYMGAPMVYYGDEIGLDSPSLANGVNGPEDDPYNRAPYPWVDEAGDTDAYGPADADLLARYTRLAQLRQYYGALRADGFDTLLTGDTTAGSSDNTTYAYARHGSGDVAIVALNPGGGVNTATVTVDAYYSEGATLEDMLSGDIYTVTGGAVELSLPARSGVLLLPPLPTGDLTVTKVVVGATPGADWAFTGTLGPFYLPASGGGATYSDQATGDYTIEETYVPGWVTAVSCTPGSETGGRSVTLTLDADEAAECVFTNTLCQPGFYDDMTACVPADPGHYVDTAGAVAQIACVPGYYQPNSAAILCNAAAAGYYVDTPAATEPTACPANTTSPAGSDSIDDCVSNVADLTIVKETDPDGGTGFPFTLDPGAATFADKWGVNGVGQGDFNGPFGIAVDEAGNVYVADTFAYRVQKFDAAGNFILMWGRDVQVGGVTGFEICLAAETCKAGTSGSGNGEMNLPHGIAVDDAGYVYVADSSNHRIQKFEADGDYVAQWGGSGVTGGLFDRPNGVALDEAGNIYVADTFNNRIQKLDANGNFLLAWGYNVIDGGGINFEICTPSDTCQKGTSVTPIAAGALNTPSGVSVYGPRVYVADSQQHRVQVFDTNGNYLSQWGSAGSSNGQFNTPLGITVDAAGNVYVADSNLSNTNTNDRIQKFDAAGNYLGQWGSQGSSDGQFFTPAGLAVYGASVYVTEYEGHRVQRFSQTGATLDDGQSHPFEDLAPGTYLVSELVPAGWTLTDIDCGAATVTESGNTARVTLAGGDDVTCTFTNTQDVIDTTPPNTTIDTGPDDPTNDNNPSFSFSSDEPDSTFQCKLDSGPWEACNSGTKSYTSVANGAHTFYVYATDTAGNPDPTPAEYPFTIDTAAPDTTIDTNPLNPSTSSSATFTFSGSDPGGSGVASFECRLDGGGWTACSSPQTYTGLSDSSHTFEVRAIDAAGNTDATPAGYTWLIDTAAPVVIITAAPPALTSDKNPSFSFSSETGATFECQLGASPFEECTSPISFSGLADGPHTFTVQATDAAGNTGTDSHTWTIDTTPPDTTITGNPSNPSNSSSATFTFSGSDPGGSGVASFECRLDGGGWTACTSPQTYTGLSDSSHTFEVRAIDAAGNTDPTPAGYTWTIDTGVPDTTPPNTTIDTGPDNPTNDNNPSFTFSSNEPGSTFECRLDAGGWEACNGGSKSYTTVGDGAHTFYVYATDTAGNPDPTPAEYPFSVDTAAPDTTIDTNPPNPSNNSSASFTFSGSDPGGSGVASFECRIDGGAWTACTSPQNYTGLSDSSHTFEVQAIDAAGNTDTSPAGYTWLIDTAAPDTTITANPPNPSNSSSASFTFSGSDPGGSGLASFECRIDGGAWTACTSPRNYIGLSDSSHTFEVRATDAAGNTDTSPAGYTWLIDTAAPPSGAIYMTAAAGSIPGGPTYQDNDILRWDGDVWSVWFDGEAADLQQAQKGKNQVHNINAFAILDADAQDIVMAFSQTRRFVPGIISPVDGMDLVRWNGSTFSFYFDGSDVGLTQKTPEKIDGLHILPGTASPINGGDCLAYLLISTQGPGKVPRMGGGTLSFGGEDVLGFCATQLGTTTAGHWHIVVDGSLEGMPKNSTDSLSVSADGQTLYVMTRGGFHVDSANGGHSSIYAYDLYGSDGFSGPLFRAADEGLTKKVDGLDVIGDLP